MTTEFSLPQMELHFSQLLCGDGESAFKHVKMLFCSRSAKTLLVGPVSEASCRLKFVTALLKRNEYKASFVGLQCRIQSTFFSICTELGCNKSNLSVKTFLKLMELLLKLWNLQKSCRSFSIN